MAVFSNNPSFEEKEEVKKDKTRRRRDWVSGSFCIKEVVLQSGCQMNIYHFQWEMQFHRKKNKVMEDLIKMF